MSYNLVTAAAAAGINRSTVLRAIKTGKISATKDELGGWVIEPAELHRVYPPVAAATEYGDAPQHDTTSRVASLEAQLASLREVAALLREQRDDALSQRDKWEAQAMRLSLPKPVPEQVIELAHPFGLPVQQDPEQQRARWWPWRRSA